MRVDYAGRRTNVGRDVSLSLDMHVLCAIEAWGTTGPYTIGAESLDGFFFEGLVGDEVVEIVGGEICDGAAVGELAFGARCTAEGSLSVELRNSCSASENVIIPYNDRPLLVLCFLECVKRRDERFWSPVLNELVDFLGSYK